MFTFLMWFFGYLLGGITIGIPLGRKALSLWKSAAQGKAYSKFWAGLLFPICSASLDLGQYRPFFMGFCEELISENISYEQTYLAMNFLGWPIRLFWLTVGATLKTLLFFSRITVEFVAACMPVIKIPPEDGTLVPVIISEPELPIKVKLTVIRNQSACTHRMLIVADGFTADLNVNFPYHPLDVVEDTPAFRDFLLSTTVVGMCGGVFRNFTGKSADTIRLRRAIFNVAKNIEQTVDQKFPEVSAEKEYKHEHMFYKLIKGKIEVAA